MKRKNFIFFLIILFCVSCTSKSFFPTSPKREKSVVTTEKQQIALQNAVVNYGMEYLQTPYRYGGTTARGFDCSGFTSFVFKEFGYTLSRSSSEQAEQFPFVAKKDLTTADLVFFEGRSRNGKVGHVGIVTENKGNGEFQFIHATVSNGVIISSSKEAYYANRYLKGGRVIERISYIAVNSQNNTQKSEVPKSNKSKATNAKSSTRNPYVIENNNSIDARYHIVQRGEKLHSIAIKYDVPVSTLMQLNQLKSKRIKKGQRLIISE